MPPRVNLLRNVSDSFQQFVRGEDIDYVFNDIDVAGSNDKPDNMNIDDKMMR